MIKKLATGFEAAWKAERELPQTASNREIDAAVARTGAFVDLILERRKKASMRTLARINLWRNEGLWPEMEILFERLRAL